MTGKMNRKEVSQPKSARRRTPSTHAWQIEDAARFLFKAQCYDAGPDSETRCGLCGECIRLCYVLRVLEEADSLAPEVDKLTIGECCFQPIKAVNDKLYRQLLAAAINLRTYMEGIERDKQIFASYTPNKIECPPSPLDIAEEPASPMFATSVAQGGEHV